MTAIRIIHLWRIEFWFVLTPNQIGEIEGRKHLQNFIYWRKFETNKIKYNFVKSLVFIMVIFMFLICSLIYFLCKFI